jgi:hypothetical protein
MTFKKNLMRGFDLSTQQSVDRSASHVHYEDQYVQIRSSIPVAKIATTSILDVMLPGNLATYIYPENSILISKENKKLHEILKMYELHAKQHKANTQTAVFDVLPQQDADEEEEEEDVDEQEEEGEEEEEDVWDEEEELIEDVAED